MAFTKLLRTAVALPFALAIACSQEPPTAPDLPAYKSSGGGNSGNLSAPAGPIVSNGGVVPLDDPNAGGVPYTIAITNSSGTLHGIVLEGYVTQISQTPTAQHIAGSTVITCAGGTAGVLPKGTCNTGFTITASNILAGPGTLVPGAASFDLLVKDRKGNLLLFTSAPITLQ
ncbi:MAG TPA: hypothetical protein VJQ46_13215 [Gemmatimonadales bacterium]|nr:hypothetical protein [Gemmatimonadales bacterium]